VKVPGAHPVPPLQDCQTICAEQTPHDAGCPRLELTQHSVPGFAGGCDGLTDVFFRIGGGNERGFELRRRQINAAVQHGVEETRESRGVGMLSRFVVENGASGEVYPRRA
jgi:hypothetical protein